MPLPGITRERVRQAFWELVSATPGFAAFSERFVHWDQVSDPQLPFMTMLKRGEDRVHQEDGTPAIHFTYLVLLYTSAGLDPTNVPEVQMNTLLDELDLAVSAAGSDLMQNRQTLGGLVWYCRPQGNVFVDAGEVDGRGVAAVGFEILCPWYV